MNIWHALLLLMFATNVVNAETILVPMRVLKIERCETGGGFFLWDSKKCLVENDWFFIDGERVQLKEVKRVEVRQKRRGHQSVGDIHRGTYEGDRVTLHIELELLPGCDYDFEQCTYRNYLARFTLLRSGRRPLKYEGVGYAGS